MTDILIVKLGAMGDVLRTTPLLTALKKKYPQSRIAWLADPRHAEVLERNALIDRLMLLESKTPAQLKNSSYDLAINLDKDEEALDAITAAQAGKKIGFGRGKGGELAALDALSDYAYRLGIDDELKFRQNEKSYQEIIFEQAGLVFQGEEYLFDLGAEDAAFAQAHLTALGVRAGAGPLIGLNTGSGARFAGKKLPIGHYARLARLFKEKMGAQALLLGGRDEIERNRRIQAEAGGAAIDTGSHPIRRFAGIVKACDLVISGDTIAMHIAIAVKTPLVVFFGSTCAAEIELYGRGRKIVSALPCAPCYLKDCPIDERCMEETEPALLFEAAKEILARSPKAAAR